MKRYIRSYNLDDIPEENKHGDCFVSALHNQVNHSREGYILVHGIVTGQGVIEGIQYCHAWCEKGDMVYDLTLPSKYQKMPKIQYYAIGNIEITKRYKPEQTYHMIEKYGTYGPWDKVFEGYP